MLVGRRIGREVQTLCRFPGLSAKQRRPETSGPPCTDECVRPHVLLHGLQRCLDCWDRLLVSAEVFGIVFRSLLVGGLHLWHRCVWL